MAVIRRVLSSSCRGLIVVLLAMLVGLAMPASAMADPADVALVSTRVGADGSMQATATAHASNPVNPVAIADAHSGSKSHARKKLANTGVDGAGEIFAFAGLLLAFGMALVAVRRRD